MPSVSTQHSGFYNQPTLVRTYSKLTTLVSRGTTLSSKDPPPPSLTVKYLAHSVD